MAWKWIPSFKMKRVLGFGGPTKIMTRMIVGGWLRWSIVDCQLRGLAVPSVRKWSSCPVGSTSEDGWCDATSLSELAYPLIFWDRWESCVRGCWARLLRVCSGYSVPLVWFDCKDFIFVGSLSWQAARILSQLEQRGGRTSVGSTSALAIRL